MTSDRTYVMRRSAHVCLVLLVTAMVVGCTRPTWTCRPRTFDRTDLARVEHGMSRGEVLDLLGRPTDVSKTALHWEVDRYTDAWVFFGGGGRRVTGTHWQDGQSLRLSAMPPVDD